MPLCSSCKQVKPAQDFYTYRTRSGKVMLKNPCVECSRRITKISKTGRAQLTAKRGSH